MISYFGIFDLPEADNYSDVPARGGAQMTEQPKIDRDESWKIFTEAVREFAKACGDHATRELLKDCANTIDELDYRVMILETWVAGTGRLDEFNAMFAKRAMR
jgi:hypothetical protein